METTHYQEFCKLESPNINQYLVSIEREILLNTLSDLRWNRTKAARFLGITFRALRYRIERAGLEDNGAGRRTTPPGFTQVWPKLRAAAFDILGHQCALCGATDAKTKLHVDHIKPMRHFPELALDLSNLQILCQPCNLAKSDKY